MTTSKLQIKKINNDIESPTVSVKNFDILLDGKNIIDVLPGAWNMHLEMKAGHMAELTINCRVTVEEVDDLDVALTIKDE